MEGADDHGAEQEAGEEVDEFPRCYRCGKLVTHGTARYGGRYRSLMLCEGCYRAVGGEDSESLLSTELEAGENPSEVRAGTREWTEEEEVLSETPPETQDYSSCQEAGEKGQCGSPPSDWKANRR